MGVIFDILGSFIVRAAIISIILNLMLTLHETLHKNTDRIYLNEVMKAPSETISYDLKLAGYNASKTFQEARASEMIFYGAVDSAGGASRTIRYHLVSGILYRTLDAGTPMEIARNVTAFALKYYNVNGTQLAYSSARTDVKSVSVDITIVSTNTLKSFMEDSTTPLSVTWNGRIFPLNL